MSTAARPHKHTAHATASHPAYNPSRFEEWCACGHYRYRVTGGPWTPWEPAEADLPQRPEVKAPRVLRASRSMDL